MKRSVSSTKINEVTFSIGSPCVEYTFLIQSIGPLYLSDFGSCSLSFCVCNNNFTLSTGAARDLLQTPLNPPEMKLEMKTEASTLFEVVDVDEELQEDEMDVDM